MTAAIPSVISPNGDYPYSGESDAGNPMYGMTLGGVTVIIYYLSGFVPDPGLWANGYFVQVQQAGSELISLWYKAGADPIGTYSSLRHASGNLVVYKYL